MITRERDNRVLTTQKDLIEYIDKLLSDCEKEDVKQIYIDHFKIGKKYKNEPKVSVVYKIISEILKSQGIKDVGELTVWRYAKIKEASPEICEKVRSGELKIKEAYNIVFPPKIKRVEEEKELLDTSNLLAVYKKLVKEIEKQFDKLSEKELDEIDSILFKTRKFIGDKRVEQLLSEDE